MTTTGSNLINYGLAFVEGFALILSPCILPILPIMLSGTIEGGKKRPLGIICGFVITFALFTLFSRFLVQHLGVDLDIVRKAAFILIACFGVVLISDYLSEKFSHFTQRIANVGANITTGKTEGGFFSGLFLGAFISLIWVPCGGPIIAAAIVQTAVQKTSLLSFFTFFFFALGSAIPMLIIALVGRKVIDKISFLKNRSGLLRKLFGVIIVFAALFAPFAGNFVAVAGYAPMPAAPNVTQPMNTNIKDNEQLIHGLSNPYPAPPLAGNSAWINSAPLTLAQLKGKVVLIDFWTYSCINCIRTLPYLKSWYDKYHQDGFVIIGVHTPEFEFEKNLTNVKEAVAKDQIIYPVVLDNDYKTWLNYNNQYWPADYLIDKNGNVVYQHFGEGDYAEAEHNIRTLLGIKAAMVSEMQKPQENELALLLQTPETYLGSERAQTYAGTQPLVADLTQKFAFPAVLAKDNWALQGKWTISQQRITSVGNNPAVRIHFFAGKVYAVMGSVQNKPVIIKVLLNGKPISNDDAGKDVKNGYALLTGHTLYSIVSLKKPATGILELIPASSGAEFYTFTFGD